MTPSIRFSIFRTRATCSAQKRCASATLLACKGSGRGVVRAGGVEIDPVYADVTIRRWQAFTKGDAILEATGETYAEVAARRSADRHTCVSQPAPGTREVSATEPGTGPDWISLCRGEP